MFACLDRSTVSDAKLYQNTNQAMAQLAICADVLDMGKVSSKTYFYAAFFYTAFWRSDSLTWS
jgi:hypothetical protein